MLLSDFQVIPSLETKLNGSVIRQSRYAYAISPYGQGCRITVVGGTGTAVLEYNWRDGPSAEVRISSDRFGMTETTISGGRKSDTILQLTGNTLTTTLTDDLLLSLFVVNHHYARRTGPFERPAA
jgi:hypothetical protein